MVRVDPRGVSPSIEVGYAVFMHRRAFILAALALSGCASAPPTVAPPIVPAPPARAPTATAATSPLAELEPLYRADAGREALTISVASHGCTTKGDFAFYVERKGEAVTLAFGRKRIDSCKSFAMGKTELSFTWAELGVPPRTQVFLLNPVTPWTGPGS